MKNLIYIVIILLQGVSLFASADRAMLSKTELNAFEYNLKTDTAEEITASWEKDSEAKLVGERVLSDLRNNVEHGLAMNAFCSSESIEKIIALRILAADIISSVNSSKKISNHNTRGRIESIVAAEILAKTGRISITPLTQRELKLIDSAENINLSNDIFSARVLTSGNIPIPEYASSVPCVTIPAQTFNKLKSHPEKKNTLVYNSTYIECRKNLYDNEFADLYKLFLYVRDNSANGKTFFLKYNKFPFITIQPLFNLTRYKNTSTTNNEIIQPGAPS